MTFKKLTFFQNGNVVLNKLRPLLVFFVDLFPRRIEEIFHILSIAWSEFDFVIKNTDIEIWSIN